MLQRIRNSFYTKVVAVYMVFSLVGDIIYPVVSYGLTSGPIDINQASFEPASTSEMVNLSTGDFTYNIPLMDVDGYPINIAYHGGVTMEQEASMVGLGWTLNVGAMNRMKKGLPDDFKGDEIKTTMNLRPRTNTSVSLGANVEVFGLEADIASNVTGQLGVGVGGSFGISFNNYYGYGLDIGANGGLSIGAGSDNFAAGLGLGIDVNSSTQSGLSISPSASLSAGVQKGGYGIGGSIGIGFTINSMQGLQNVTTTSGIGLSSPSMSAGIGTSGNIPVSTVSYTPSIAFETSTKSGTYSFDLGGEIWGTTVHGLLSGSKSTTCLADNIQTAKAFGYLYEHAKNKNQNYLMDFNREGRVIPNKHIAYLPVTNHTFDVFSASAQGVGFISRPFRSDVLVVSEANKNDDVSGLGVSGELSIGNLFQAGININNVDGYIKTGEWSNNNSSDEEFVSNSEPNSLYEHSYFKKFGNRSASNHNFYNSLLLDTPLKQSIGHGIGGHNGLSKFESNEGLEFNFNSINHYKTERDLRNTSIEYLTSNEAESFGLENDIYSYDINEANGYNFSTGNYTSSIVLRNGENSDDAKAHHIGEMSVLKGDGSRYVYGIPVLNTKTYEVMFNVSDETSFSDPILQKDCKTGLVTYNPGVDNSIDNRRGDNNFYVKKEIPASANSYLLTGYLSSNYVDRTQDGLTPDDLGGYTKFNYAKMDEPARWRFPYEENTAMYSPGLLANDYDDVGTYMYGEREQWYTHSIESKNFVAEFHYSDRYDSRGVVDENGGVNTAVEVAAKQLDYISLYTIEGKKNGEAPIKTVHFEYDNELCQDVPNTINTNSGQKGKLTLKSIYFTYGDSNRGKLHKYKFDYNNYNPSYSLGETNRWGTYSPANTNASCGDIGDLNQYEFPYANQIEAEANLHANAWMLKTIHLPSGSDINIEVESDDYSYLQEKVPSKMMKVIGLSQTGSLADMLDGPDRIFETLAGPNNFIHIALDEEIVGDYTGSRSDFIQNYLRDMNDLYFKFLVSVTRRGLHGELEEKFEYVSGYAELEKSFVHLLDTDSDASNNDYDMAIIKIKGLGVGDYEGNGNTSPIAKASWQMIRKYLPRVLNSTVGNIYTDNDSRPYDYNCEVDENLPADPDQDDPSPSDDTNDEGNGLRNLYNLGVSQAQNLLSFGGFNNMMKFQGFASKFVPHKSWVRLYQGNRHKKIGGGHRVSEISVNDNWNEVKDLENSSEYGTVYNYETEATSDFTDASVISSGVASYEPITSGADENSFRQPVNYSIDVVFRVNDEEFQETPIGENIFANPSVVYSKVTVKNRDYPGVNQDATGSTEYEFFTAKDFPSASKVKSTGEANVDYLENNNSFLEALIGNNYNYLTMSQGYTINVNDMHGKFKSKKVLTSGFSPKEVYYLEHKYYTEQFNVLKNSLPVVNEKGVISTRDMGKDIDMVVDLSQSDSYTESSALQFGIDVSLPLMIIPSFWYSSTSQHSKFQSSVTTKVVYSNGILEEIVLRDKGREKKSTNLLFDEKTGVPIVTKITAESEAGDDNIPIYQYDYPAYWVNKGMGLASENWGATFNGSSFFNSSTGNIDNTIFSMLNPGDEIGLFTSNGLTAIDKYWVVEDEANENTYYLQDKMGNEIVSGYGTSSYQFKVLKSGKKNLLGSTFMSITSLDNNLNIVSNAGVITSATSPYDGTVPHTNILNASAVEYIEKASAYATLLNSNPNYKGVIEGDQVNPYIEGLLGNWNLLSSYVLDVDRAQTLGNIRQDGVLNNYVPYWVYQNEWKKNDDSNVSEKWITAATATLIDGEGYNLESKDALGIYSSILLGYNNSLKIAEAVNSRYYEIGFDGFEDRNYDVINPETKKHFRFEGDIVNEAHTGRYCLKVAAGQKSVRITVPKTNAVNETSIVHSKPYTLGASDVIDPFSFIVSPVNAKKYVFTAWIKQDITAVQITDYNFDLTIAGGQVPILKETKSNIIDGWQRVEVIFELPAETITTSSSVIVDIGGPNYSSDLFIDDIRIQPYNSEMVSYVIDPISLRLWATLDSRNFATFYQYDEEGSLVRIIQETERGKVTVQENRAGIKIN